MPQSCRNAIRKIWEDKSISYGANAGLLRDRYLERSVKDDEYEEASRRLRESICKAITQVNALYKLAYAKELEYVQKPAKDGIFETLGRMVIGLGSENVLETGLSLQHTYGTPLIPGSALKGLAAHYCDQVWGVIDDEIGPDFKLDGTYHKTIFGTSEDSGHIIFHDAWITPESLVGSLKPDVMTPHHSNYYSNKNGAAPTDYDDPKPIIFLSIAGSFHVAVSCDVDSDDGKKWTDLAFKILTEALCEWGIGGKTNTGYGRLVPEGTVDPDPNKVKPPVPPGPVPPWPAKKTLKHQRGDIVDVTRVPDPKEKRGAAYFISDDDGIGGPVVQGTPPLVEVGQKARLVIVDVMENDGRYNFAAIGAKKEPVHQSEGKRGSR